MDSKRIGLLIEKYNRIASESDEWFRGKIERMESKQIHKIQPSYLAQDAVRSYGHNIPNDVLSKIKNLGYDIPKFLKNCDKWYSAGTIYKEGKSFRNGNYWYNIARGFWWVQLDILMKMQENIADNKQELYINISQRRWDLIKMLVYHNIDRLVNEELPLEYVIRNAILLSEKIDDIIIRMELDSKNLYR